ncbi:MAG: hypothetical protein Q4A84_01135 [Neisseria sp.]|uniref:hypothetical protein n=1 Tax=Neisseria sp. TaxID=192066 RepID=UPI0026DD4120|nr:hypothetical protein [Neisseria sp.]MDO4640297.1 hypothetical protein [Neisseria sp.]
MDAFQGLEMEKLTKACLKTVQTGFFNAIEIEVKRFKVVLNANTLNMCYFFKYQSCLKRVIKDENP